MWRPTVLVVEDELGPRESFRQILKNNYNVVTKQDGKSAIEYIVSQSHPEAILLDIRMPDMNGIEVLKKVKEINPKIEVVMITAHASLATAKEAMKYGASEYLIKPSNVKEIRKAVKNAIARKIQGMQYNEKFSTLLEISQSITSSLTLEDVYEKTLDWCEKFFLGQIIWLALYNFETEEIEIVASKGFKEEEALYPGIKQINEHVIERKQNLFINTQKDENFIGNNSLKEAEISSIWAFPLEVSNRAIGVLAIGSSQFENAETDPMTINLLTIFTNQIAIALESNLSRQQLQKNLEKLKLAQKQLVQAERFRAFGEMASGAAHNFNNFLTGILGYVSLLLRSDFTDPESFIPKIKQIEELAKESSVLVKRLQASTKEGYKTEFKIVNLRKLVKDTLNLTSLRWQSRINNKEINVETNLQEIYPIMGNETRLKEVLTNLIFNAVDAMPQGGKLKLETFNEGDFAVIIVADTGIGMTKEVKEKAFEPFFTTKKEDGTGLGLSTTYEIVQEHNGEILLESEPGKGTTFKIKLPKPVFNSG